MPENWLPKCNYCHRCGTKLGYSTSRVQNVTFTKCVDVPQWSVGEGGRTCLVRLLQRVGISSSSIFLYNDDRLTPRACAVASLFLSCCERTCSI